MQSLDESQISFYVQHQANLKVVNQKTKQLQKQTKNVSAKNTLSQFCLNKQCQQINKFLCNDDQCECNQKQQQCQKGKIKVVLKKFNKNLLSKQINLNNKLVQYL